MEKLITILTATYNRAHLLHDLYHSLQKQTLQAFEWMIIDDGSTDRTKELIQGWLVDNNTFNIQYHYIINGGKNRAINYGVKHIITPYTLIIDSDDYLTEDAIEFLSNRLIGLEKEENIAGIAGLRGIDENNPLNQVDFPKDKYIICNNLDRKQYHLEKDSNEVYRTSILLNHPFVVWENEKFSPEEIVWNQIALEGYSLHWYNKVTCIVRYQEGGLTKDSFNLIKKNPMGYAMMYKQRVALCATLKSKIYNASQMIAYAILGKQIPYIFKGNNLLITILAVPIGFLLSIRRKIQYKQ